MMMINQKRAIFLFCALLAANAEAKQATSDHATEKAIGTALSPFVVERQLAGYVTVLIKNDKHVATKVEGYADLVTRRIMAKDTIFHIYSMTKPNTPSPPALLNRIRNRSKPVCGQL